MKSRHGDQLEDCCNSLARENAILAKDSSSEVGGELVY